MSDIQKIKDLMQRGLIDTNTSDGELLDELYGMLSLKEEVHVKYTTDMPNDSKFVKPKRIIYEEKGAEKIWDVVDSHNSVAVIVHNLDTGKYIFVKQFRPAVWNSGGTGYCLELCAGIVDKDKSLAEIAREEVFEELGYEVPLVDFQQMESIRTSVGILGSMQTLFHVNVQDGQKTSKGGGINGENIEVVEYSKDELNKLTDVELTFGVIYAQREMG